MRLRRLGGMALTPAARRAAATGPTTTTDNPDRAGGDLLAEEGFFLVEVFDPNQTDRTAQIGQRPTDPGFALQWQEITPTGAYRRSGVVLSPAPRSAAVWVQPACRQPGEGPAVVVDNVTARSAAAARRIVGGPGDHLSTAAWQAPWKLPHAWLRGDRFELSDGEAEDRYRLHADPACEHPRALHAETVLQRGDPVPLEHCFVFDGFLHPLSRRPFVPGLDDPGTGTRVIACGACLRDGEPSGSVPAT
jgi:hypothetical protein